MRDIHGAPRSLTEVEAGAIYDTLVREARAKDCADERGCFVRYATSGRDVEWRFMGSLGFGGKLYFDGWQVPRVGCYRENETPERLETIARTNAILADMFAARQEAPHGEG